MNITWYDLYHSLLQKPIDLEIKEALEDGSFPTKFISLSRKVDLTGLKGFSDKVTATAEQAIKQRGIKIPSGTGKQKIISYAYSNGWLTPMYSRIVGYVSEFLAHKVTPYDMPSCHWLEIFCRTYDLKAGSNIWKNYVDFKDMVGADNLVVLQQEVDELAEYM